MPEEEVETQPTEEEPQEGDAEPGKAKTFDADYVEKLRKESAKYRTEAKSNAEAAKKLAELEQANMSEIEKANGRVTSAEAERDSARAEAMRLRVANAHGISLEDADLFLTGTTEDVLTAQAKRLSDRAAEQANAEAERKKRNPIVSKEGTSTKTGTTTEEENLEFADNFFNGGGS